MQSSTRLHNSRETGWTLRVVLSLGRVSNLPTVWTNSLAGILLAGGSVFNQQLLPLLLAMSLAYIGGMFLNDAFDREIDSLQRPERPIPAGLVSAHQVFIAGFSMLLLSVLLVYMTSSSSIAATIAALLLAGFIVLYNCWHKRNPISPLIMGMCRMMVYISCGLAVSDNISTLMLIGGALTLSYLIGLTYTAKQENFDQVAALWPLAFLAAPVIFGVHTAVQHPHLWMIVLMLGVWIIHCLYLIFRRLPGDIPKAVVRLIAGISIIDTLLMLAAICLLNPTGSGEFVSYGLATMGLLAFSCTLFLQRFIAGT